MNKVIISGRVTRIIPMSKDTIIAVIVEEETKDIFYAFWDNNRFKNLTVELLKKRVALIGSLEYIKVKFEQNMNVRRMLAIFVEHLEFYEDE